MPTISQFFGIAIRMYYEDHGPSHFHAYYGGAAAAVAIDSLAILHGELPHRVYRMVLEWAVEHRPALWRNWLRARDHRELEPIAPLE